MEKKRELKEISLLKIEMTILVVLYHSCLFFSGNWFTCVNPVFKPQYFDIFSKWLNTFHIQTFTFISGYLFFYLKSIGNYSKVCDSIKKRAKRLLIPLLFTEIFWVFPFYIYYFGFDLEIVVKKFILLESPEQLWFLPMLFWIFVFYEVFYEKITFSIKNIVLIYLFTTFIYGILNQLEINYFNISKAVEYSLFFYLGGFLFYKKEKLNNKVMLHIITMSILLLICWFTLNYNCKINNVTKVLRLLLTTILSSLEAILLYKLSDFIINIKGETLDNKIYRCFKENAFGIYLFHQQIIYITISIFNGLIHPILHCSISFIISLSVSSLITILLKKNKITKKIFAL